MVLKKDEEAEEFVMVRTGVSPAHWCSMQSGRAEFLPASMKLPGMGKAEPVAWLDNLLNGGIKMPARGSKRRPTTLLISGPPGGGKTTLAVELCVRLARGQQGMKCLYVSTDQDTAPLIENAAELFGTREGFVRYHKPSPDERAALLVCGRDLIKPPWWKRFAPYGRPVVVTFLELALGALKGWPPIVVIPHGQPKPDVALGGPKHEHVPAGGPDVLVVDGLNSIEPSGQARAYARFLRAASPGVRLLVFILDSSPEGDSHRPWEYACDLALHLDYSVAGDYYVRSLQIVKARYQSHVWGVHQFKPYKPESHGERPTQPAQGSQQERSDWEKKAEDWDAQRRRDHPYRSVNEGGGALIYPSIHYYLSLYKRRGSLFAPSYAATWPANLSEKLGGGLPEGRCTAFIGTRGGHKSHLGYAHVLHRIVNHGESGIIVSLRDDESMTKDIIKKILTDELGVRADVDEFLRGLERDDKLEILYYHPGYITPEEFMHRMFVSLHRVKARVSTTTGRSEKVSVLFNSLDQLSSRFPLCAREAILIPGIVEMLTGEGVTSIFIAVEEPGQPPAQYGLLPMADLILSFHSHRFRGSDYFRILQAAKLDALKDEGQSREWHEKIAKTFPEEIVLRIVRYSGGKRAGMRGILTLTEQKESVYGKRGIHFIPIGDTYEFVEEPGPTVVALADQSPRGIGLEAVTLPSEYQGI